VGGADAPMRRVLVLGSPGAGKTTFARRLAERLPLPVIHLDCYYWRSGWRASEEVEWREKVKALAIAPDWIMEGNYSNTFDIRMPRADTLIWLDRGRLTCMRRVVMRIITGYGRTRPELPDECPEQFSAEFLRFVWDFPAEYRPRIVDGIAKLGTHLQIFRLANDREAHDFLAGVGN
jgi:adenylate kinase family enzyme